MSLAAWEYRREDVTPAEAAIIAAGRLEPPSLLVEVVGRGEYVTVLIMSGALPDPTAILHIENHGTFEIVSAEPWPESGRLLVLRALRNRVERAP